jgi:tetratricopeptide (TPR) repeat protein
MQHYYSSRVIISSRTIENEFEFVLFLEKKLEHLLSELGYNQDQTKYYLAQAGRGYQLRNHYKQKGDNQLDKDPTAALKSYNKALSLYLYDPKIIFKRSVARQNLGDKNGYLGDIEMALSLYPNDPIARYHRAQFYIGEKSWNKALEDLNVAINSDNQDVNFYLARSKCFEKIGNIEMAIEDYEAVLERAEKQEDRKLAELKLKKLFEGKAQ